MSAARQRLVVVLALLALGALAVLASTQPFSTVRLRGVEAPLVVAGSTAAPALAPLGIVLLALAGALTIAGRIARLVLGALLVLLGAAVAAVALPAALDPAAGTRGAVETALGLTGVDPYVLARTGTAWPGIAAAAGALAAALGVAVLLLAPRWSTGGRRFRTRAAVRPGDPIAEWDALTAGEDPTGESAGGSPPA